MTDKIEKDSEVSTEVNSQEDAVSKTEVETPVETSTTAEEKGCAPVENKSSQFEEDQLAFNGRIEKNVKKALDSTTRSTLFSIGAFMVSLYGVYLIAELDSKTDGIYSEAKSTLTALGPLAIDRAESQSIESRDIYPTDQRVMSIASTLLLRGVSLKDSKQYLEDVELEVALDSREQYFFKTMAAYGSPLAMVQRSADKEITLFDKWKITFESADAYLLEQFPMNPTLVMNHESVAFPECVEGAEPYIAYAKATLEGTTWEEEPSVIKDDNLGRWIFTFNDIEPLDTEAFNRRILAVPNCRLSEKTDASTSE